MIIITSIGAHDTQPNAGWIEPQLKILSSGRIVDRDYASPRELRITITLIFPLRKTEVGDVALSSISASLIAAI